MHAKSTNSRLPVFISILLLLTGLSLACSRSALPEEEASWRVPGLQPTAAPVIQSPNLLSLLPPTRLPGEPILTPTPDNPHPVPSPRTDAEKYIVQYGDTLGIIAEQYNISQEQLMEANQLYDPNLLAVGQELFIPIAQPEGNSPDFKIIPDSELVYGPSAALFDIKAFVNSKGGYLSSYQEEISDKVLSGSEIVVRVSQDYSVNPRLLLAILQYQSQWLTKINPKAATLDYPLGIRRESQKKGLYHQLAWAANQLNRGYYLWRVNGASTWLLTDGKVIPVSATINAGTAGVQNLFAQLYGEDKWTIAVSEEGLYATFNTLFGFPFEQAVEPLIPLQLKNPSLQLPFEPGKVWSFTGGPHPGWDNGSAWAALDFAPPGEANGCMISQDWVAAVGDGLIIRTGEGVVIQDLDIPGDLPSDGYEQTGWVILYMHVDEQERVESGVTVKAGEHIGHPSCEGGLSNGTHVHIARRYNGEWIAADQNMPFILDNWVSIGVGVEYDGFLERDGVRIEAEELETEENDISR
ncbi:MAG: LysM peptidoglycan-binding domain-containing protein [Anaerolineales bacterium]|nr:LysM peptidoglycan-binding domain-containing protein [Anaerolineales bacterium]